MSTKPPPYWFYGYDIPAHNIQIIVNGKRHPVTNTGDVGRGETPDWYADRRARRHPDDQYKNVQFHRLLNDEGDPKSGCRGARRWM